MKRTKDRRPFKGKREGTPPERTEKRETSELGHLSGHNHSVPAFLLRYCTPPLPFLPHGRWTHRGPMSLPAADARGIDAHAERSGSPARWAPHTRSPRGGTQRTQTPAPESGQNPAPNSWLAVLSSKCANFPEAPSSHVRTGVTRQWSSHSTELLRKSEGGKYFTSRRVTLKSL